MKQLFLWYTDTHLDKVLPWNKVKFIRHIVAQKPKGVFITGDISNGLTTCFNLKMMATFIKCPIYFILGNHDYFFSNFQKTHNKIREMCNDYPNLIWLTQEMPIKLNNDSCLIGTEGWYDASIGDPKYLKFTFDWFLTKDFRKLSSMDERIQAFRNLATQSCDYIKFKLKCALENECNTIYLMTHFPPWKEAGRNSDSFFNKYHYPYDVNVRLGQTIEKIMANQDKKLIVLSGHTHQDAWVHVSNNIECRVNAAKYYNVIRNEERLFI